MKSTVTSKEEISSNHNNGLIINDKNGINMINIELMILEIN